MIRRMIAVTAALAMVYGSSLLPAAESGGVPVKTSKTEIENPKSEIYGPIVPERINYDIEPDTFVCGISTRIHPDETSGSESISDEASGDYGCPEPADTTGNAIGADDPEGDPDGDQSDEQCAESTESGDPELGGTVEVVEPEPEPELTPEPAPEPEPAVEEPQMEYLGDWVATGYCPAECCCGQWAWGATASGAMPTANHTVACNSLPFGTQLMIDGTVYTVEDTGWTLYGDAWVDIFFDTHDQALAWGERTVSVYIVR